MHYEITNNVSILLTYEIQSGALGRPCAGHQQSTVNNLSGRQIDEAVSAVKEQKGTTRPPIVDSILCDWGLPEKYVLTVPV